MKRLLFHFLLVVFAAGCAIAQCPKLNDGKGVPSDRPYWISCSGKNFTLFIQSADTIGAYTVDFGDGSPLASGTQLVPPAFISHTYTVTVDTFIITFTETSTGCKIKGVVVMENTPSASIEIPAGNPITGCTPAVFNFRNGSTNTSRTTKFTWNFGDGSPSQIYDYTNNGQTVSHTYPKGTTNCNVAVTLTAENYCNAGNPSSNIYQPIQVWDLDNAQVAVSASILCFPNRTFHFSNASNLNCFAQGNNSQRYEYWNFGNYWGKGKDSIITWQPYNPPNRPGYNIHYPGLGTYTVMLIDSNFCGKDTVMTTVQIVLPPVAAFKADRDTICQGESITFTNQSTGATSFSWDFKDGTAQVNSNGNTPVTHTFNNPGSFGVQLIAASSGAGTCRDTTTRTVFVKASPKATFVMDNPTACDSNRVKFTDFSVNAISWSWDFGNGQTSNSSTPPIQVYPSPKAYPVRLTVRGANGCFGSTVDSVRVYKSPTGTIAPPPSVCAKTTAIFTDSSSTSPGDPINTWSWDFGDGSPVSHLKNPSHVYSLPGTYTITLAVATAHCNGKTGSRQITVNPLPLSSFSPDASNGCNPFRVRFTDNSTAAVSRTWRFGDGTAPDTSLNPVHLFLNNSSNDTVYKVLEIVVNTFGCSDTSAKNITVYRATKAAFTSDAVPGCSPVPVNFSNQSKGAVSYSWNFGDGSPSSITASPSHQFINATPFIQYYTAHLVASSSNGCTDTAYQTITVYPKPDYNVQVFPPSQDGCSPLDVAFQASSSGVDYTWYFGDGKSSTLQNPRHIFTNSSLQDSIYTVKLIAVNAFMCSDSTFKTITVHPLPRAAFTALPDSQVFPNATVQIVNNTVNANAYTWNFGDNQTSALAAPGSHTYSTWNDYKIYLYVQNQYGCRDTASQLVKVKAPKPIADFFISDTAGCMPLFISFRSLPAPSRYARSARWDFGDGSFSDKDAPDYIYHDAGKYTVTLVVAGDGGKDTVKKTVEVYQKPVAFFTVNPSVVYVPSDPLYCLNLTTFGRNYIWRFGDGGTSQDKNPVHYYKEPGKYSITLVATNEHNCIDSITQPDIVLGDVRSDIKYPNAFTPSPDGPNGGYYERNSLNNRVFFPVTEGIVEYHLMIFNRWGEMVFETRDLNEGWDGYYKGRLCQQDAYVWKVIAKMKDGRLLNKAGDVTLLR